MPLLCIMLLQATSITQKKRKYPPGPLSPQLPVHLSSRKSKCRLLPLKCESYTPKFRGSLLFPTCLFLLSEAKRFLRFWRLWGSISLFFYRDLTCHAQQPCSRTTTPPPRGPTHAGSQKTGVKDVKAITISITVVISPDNRECEWTGIYPLLLPVASPRHTSHCLHRHLMLLPAAFLSLPMQRR